MTRDEAISRLRARLGEDVLSDSWVDLALRFGLLVKLEPRQEAHEPKSVRRRGVIDDSVVRRAVARGELVQLQPQKVAR